MKTFEHEPYTFPSIKQVNQRVGRIYRVLDGDHAGKEYPSITRVLGARPKPQLAAWRKRVGRTEANRITKESTVRGTSLHVLAESYINNEVDQVEDAVAPLTDDV